MNICVAGWYFTPGFMRALEASPHRIFVVKHREGETGGLPSALVPNIGLEFGCYDWYLKKEWDSRSGVLFIHDDTRMEDRTLADIESLQFKAGGIDHAFIFRDEWEAIGNDWAHGRAIWASARLLTELLKMGGFPFDASNRGNTSNNLENKGIRAYVDRVARIKGNKAIAIVPTLQSGRRGEISDQVCVYTHAATMIEDGVATVVR